MSIFGDIEELVGDLYPYRWPITIGLVIVLVAGLIFAYRQGWHRLVWRHKLPSAVLAAVLIGIAVPTGNYLLSPLWERHTVCEASPLPGAGAGSADCDQGASIAMAATNSPAPKSATPGATLQPTAAPAPPFVPHTSYQGDFRDGDSFHYGSGRALIIETAPGQYILRLEEFSVRNGPDLFVYLSPDPTGKTDDSLELGHLKGTDGAFNYDIPAGTDVSGFKSALVWCKPFSVLFTVATLAPA